MEDINVSSNWASVDEDKLKKIITYCSPENKECSIENVTIESCVCLTKEESDDSESKPEIEIKSTNLLNQVDILSEGSVIEIFGYHNEYLFTCECDFIDDWEGMAVYHGKIVLPEISKCRLKFTRLKKNSRLWIYNVQLGIVPAENSATPNPFNVENVNKLINNSNQQIPDKAEKFKNFLEMYKSNSSQIYNIGTQSFNLQLLLSLIGKECNTQFRESRPNASRSSNDLNFFGRSSLPENSGDTINRREFPVQISSDKIDLLKCYIDDKFNKMKEDIIKRVEGKMDELMEKNNAKLDSIIWLLESMKP